MMQFIKSLVKAIPPIKELVAERDRLRLEVRRIKPGHYYSPIPSVDDVRINEARIFDRSRRDLPGLDLNVEGQLGLLDQLKGFYNDQPFKAHEYQSLRYYFNNVFYSYTDALFLCCMIRFARPKRIIEIGSGFSSFVMLDTNQLFFDNIIRLTFIEPDDERLRSRLQDRDLEIAEVIKKPVQEVELARFRELGAGDILFVDSSHVAKVGSDVNFIILEILPNLPKGTLVHFHDVFYPFEYPKEWIEEYHRYWNEDYMLRAFLQFNSAFRICLWSHFLGIFHPDKLEECMPLCMKDIGSSLWLQRV